MMTGAEKGIHLLCKKEANEINMLLKCRKTQRWRQKLFKSVNFSKEMLYKKINGCVTGQHMQIFTKDEIKNWKTK